MTTYGHLAKINVRRGDLVNEGQVIGKMGRTGKVKGAHLHYEISVNGKSQNPATYIKIGRNLLSRTSLKNFANKNPESTMKLGKARAMIFLVAAKENVDIFEYSPNTVKKNLVGYGHATKLQISKMIERIFPDLKINDENAADALAVALCHSMQTNSTIFKE